MGDPRRQSPRPLVGYDSRVADYCALLGADDPTPEGTILRVENDHCRITNARGGFFGQFPLSPGGRLEDAVAANRTMGGPPTIKPCKYAPGDFHPRIWRGQGSPSEHEEQREAWTSSFTAVRALFLDMHEVFRVVDPARANAGAYGHDIRHLRT